MGISMEAQKEAILEKSKKTMSVPEMRRLLGLKKTDSYWLVTGWCIGISSRHIL